MLNQFWQNEFGQRRKQGPEEEKFSGIIPECSLAKCARHLYATTIMSNLHCFTMYIYLEIDRERESEREWETTTTTTTILFKHLSNVASRAALKLLSRRRWLWFKLRLWRRRRQLRLESSSNIAIEERETSWRLVKRDFQVEHWFKQERKGKQSKENNLSICCFARNDEEWEQPPSVN